MWLFGILDILIFGYNGIACAQEASCGKAMASEIQLRLYEELNDHLPPDKRKRRFAYPLDTAADVHKVLESLAVPEEEIDLVLVNGTSVDFSFPLRAGDFVSLFPVFESFDIRSISRAHAKPLRRVRFSVAAGLSRLAEQLRLLGFDVLELKDGEFEQAARSAEEERRILIARNPSLSVIPGFSRVYRVRAASARYQLLEILSRFDLFHTVPLCKLQSALHDPPNYGGDVE
jgi:hypothetical protein